VPQNEPISGEEMPTCQRPDSPFTSKYVADRHPEGKGLDFLLFRSNAGKQAAEGDRMVGEEMISCVYVDLLPLDSRGKTAGSYSYRE
jgi:hypothetical protein